MISLGESRLKLDGRIYFLVGAVIDEDVYWEAGMADTCGVVESTKRIFFAPDLHRDAFGFCTSAVDVFCFLCNFFNLELGVEGIVVALS